MSKRNIRKRRAVDDEDEDLGNGAEEEQGLSAHDIKLLQKNRQRRTGVDSAALAMPEKARRAPAPADGDDDGAGPDVLRAAFNRERLRVTDADDPQMKEYVEAELARRLGRELPEDAAAAAAAREPMTLAEQALEGAGPAQRPLDTELGAAFVAGVTEVALGVEHKLRNIEATEAAKTALLARGGTAARRRLGGGGGGGNDDEYGGGGGAEGGARRAHFPVQFGKRGAEQVERMSAAAGKRERLRAHAEGEKRKKLEQDLAPRW